MPLIALNWSPDQRVLRQFGWIACAAGVLGGVLVWRGWWLTWLVDDGGRVAVAAAMAAIGVGSGVASLLRPSINRPLFLLLSLVTYPIGFVVSIVVLAVLFFVVITPVAALLKLLGRDPLLRRFDRNLRSYWVDARPARPKEDYFRQY